jgi:putative salt-induced outer membrane protein YdiY
MTSSIKNRLFSTAVLLLVAVAITGLVDTAIAQDEKETGWFFAADFTAVWTGGNSESNTFGTKGTLQRVFTKSLLKLEAGGTQTKSTLTTRTAIGNTTADFIVDEQSVTEKTAELYFATARYDYQVHKRFLVFGGVDWLRNTFAGIDSRFLVAAGAGNTWSDNKKTRFLTDYSFTYTFQDDVVQNPITKNEFPGLRLGYDFWWKVSASTDFTSVFVGDLNLDNTDDIRVDVNFGLPVSISEKLALKPTFRMLWRNDPSLTSVPLFTTTGTDTGDSVLVPLRELDTIFTLALVVNI